jgi:hypothetical protein
VISLVTEKFEASMKKLLDLLLFEKNKAIYKKIIDLLANQGPLSSLEIGQLIGVPDFICKSVLSELISIEVVDRFKKNRSYYYLLTDFGDFLHKKYVR